MKSIAIAILSLFPTLLSAQWDIEKPLAADEIEGPLFGNIFGYKFEFGKAQWSGSALTITSKAKLKNWPEGEIIIFVSQDEEKEWVVTPQSGNSGVPHVHMKFAKEGAKFPGTLMYIGEYSMRLKLLKKEAKKATFAIHISLPDYKKTFLAGRFDATVR